MAAHRVIVLLKYVSLGTQIVRQIVAAIVSIDMPLLRIIQTGAQHIHVCMLDVHSPHHQAKPLPPFRTRKYKGVT